MTKYNWDRKKLEETAKEAICWMDWLRKLNIPTRGYNYRTLRKKAIEYNINTDHFDSNASRKRVNRTTAEKVFVSNKYVNGKTLKNFYIKECLDGVYKCECCGISSWNDKQIVLQIHHIDGNHTNNLTENLQLLCPNCHSQTDTFSNKKEKRVRICSGCNKNIIKDSRSKLCFQCAQARNAKKRAKLKITDLELLELKAKLKTNTAIGNYLGISDSYISRKLKEINAA